LGFSKAKMRLDGLPAKRPGDALAPWVVHDLRRSMATHMERIGIEPHVIEVCLGHVLKGVAGTYRQYAHLPEKAVVLQEWANELLSACAVKAANSSTAVDSPCQATSGFSSSPLDPEFGRVLYYSR
jgi:hypothetical protein